MTSKALKLAVLIGLQLGVLACLTARKNSTTTSPLDQVAGNEGVARYMKTFEGRGALADDSEPTAPAEALAKFRYPDDLALDLVLAEPAVRQPVEVSFDHRGRLWVVQYHQYPYPQGLKVVSMDNHLRAKFDKVPAPPPGATKGADKITIFEDTNGDGTFDKTTDAITGLNIATSVILGRNKVWVLNPPYLLAYPDPNGDGLPDGQPEVHLEGFGLEDTHAVANSLRWGPDGWLYGAQGSTTTATIQSAVSKNVHFLGQAIWRYHPDSRVFEIFAEGGGNTFYIEIDDKGRLYSGDNGLSRGQYYKQGGYYTKNIDKHGPHTNPYALGILPNMALEGDRKRFTHAWVKYQGGTLPARYQDAMLALNPLHSYLQLTRLQPTGSTFSTLDEARILETTDHWFRPVDLKVGPDGAVYLADWYDSRLTHIDPRDTWHKASGRIYRLRARDGQPAPKFDLSTYSSEQLVALLGHPNKWFRQQALVQLGNRKDKSLVASLQSTLRADTSQLALEALWALHLSGGFDDATATVALAHANPYVRMWAVRLLGDAHQVPPALSTQLTQLATTEPHPEVRSQLAATAKRLPGPDALPLLKNLIKYHDDAADRDIPLQLWWALEAKAESDREAVLALFEDPTFWERKVVSGTILERLMQRYLMAGGPANVASCTRLLTLAPSAGYAKVLLAGLQKGLRGAEATALPAELLQALRPYQAELREESLALALRQAQPDALPQALALIADSTTEERERLSYVRILGEINQPAAVPTLLSVVESTHSTAPLRQAALRALQRYEATDIGLRVLAAYPDKLRVDQDVQAAALALFASRTTWARQLVQQLESTPPPMSRDEVPTSTIRQLQLLNDPTLHEAIQRLWPQARLATSAEKTERIAQIGTLIQAGTGDAQAGQTVFTNRCGSCHRLFDQGGTIGPDLTGYDRSNLNYLLFNTIDPSADIREGYVNYLITTQDGRTLFGKMKARTGTSLTLEPLGGEEMTLPASQIKSMQAQETSLMPERLLDGLSDQQIRDLFSYIMKR
ncbi:HEAT repeat domain-containing protein [Rhabdobacter roseus]|uniref:Putative membrane-bound dehydrogenase-like protein n=1 Tax=Rhabdobacter roseus TaxID=1655419 RepID=A0A840TXU5_9BACT|nr:PVC-type heme-binding CxxCH protein [Rhabdobacter roseus]MBB5286397.1 putative membrane-bound dehydrogenase-like protein [Rhabdobacter roseus]